MLRSTATVPLRRLCSTVAKDNIKKIVVFQNGVVAAWHPEIPFPYEHSKPVVLEAAKKDQSPLSSAVNRATRWKNGPVNAQLKDIFYTTKNEWYTRTKEERLRSVAAPLPRRK